MKNYTHSTKPRRLYQLHRLAIAIILILLIIPQGFSQSIELKGITKDGFKGLKRLDESGYYVQYVEMVVQGKKALPQVHLYILDNDLKVTTDFVVPIGRGETIEDVSFNGENFMFIASSSAFATRRFAMVDKNGSEIASKKFEKVKRRLLTKPAVILPVGESDFIVINYIKEKKIGYSVDRYDSSLELKYASEQIPEKKKLYPVDYFVSGNQVYILEFVTPDLSDYFEYHIAAFNIEDGSQKFKQRLKSPESDASGYATFIAPGKDGSVIAGGMYFNGNRTKASNSDGFFASVISSEGDAKFSFTDWKDVKDMLKDKTTAALWGGKTKTFMHDISINGDGSFTLIGENYRRGDADLAGEKSKKGLAVAGKLMGGGDEKEEAVTVSDYTLMDFTSSGEFSGIRKLDEPPSVTVIKTTTDKEDQPYVGQRKGLNLANILNNNGYFPYRFVAGEGDNKYLVSVVKYEPQVKELLYFTKLKSATLDTTSMEITSSELKVAQELQGQIMGKLGGLGKLAKKGSKMGGTDVQNEFFLAGSHDPFDYRSKDLNTRIIESNVPGKIVIYDFIPEEDDGKKKGTMAKLGAAMKGNLQVKYIDIPK